MNSCKLKNIYLGIILFLVIAILLLVFDMNKIERDESYVYESLEVSSLSDLQLRRYFLKGASLSDIIFVSNIVRDFGGTTEIKVLDRILSGEDKEDILFEFVVKSSNRKKEIVKENEDIVPLKNVLHLYRGMPAEDISKCFQNAKPRICNDNISAQVEYTWLMYTTLYGDISIYLDYDKNTCNSILSNVVYKYKDYEIDLIERYTETDSYY